jgi:hypothetical protein
MNLKIVISLRSEYLHRLEPVETRARPFTLSHFRLKPIDPTRALAVVQSPNKKAPAIDEGAATLVAELWTDALVATRAAVNDPFGRVGLLHLQALLYALHDESGGGVVTTDHVQRLQGDGDATELFIRGLLRSIDVKLKRCRAASDAAGLDAYLVEGTAQALANSVRHLASAGYKLVRETGDLAESTMGSEFRALVVGMSRSGERSTDENSLLKGDGAPTPEQQADLLNVIVKSILAAEGTASIDLLTADRATIARLADEASTGDADVPWQQRLHVGAEAWVADPGEVTCGPMSGLAPAAVLIEEMRRFSFAMAWLRESSLIRVSTPGMAGTMVSLIHDGFGEALQRWSARVLEGPSGALAAITAPQGAAFGWQVDRSLPPLPELDGGDPSSSDEPARPRVLTNLRWKGGWVRANFRNVAFVSCDLRGTFFDRCSMTGVTFVNCLLDGVIFSDCVFKGESNAAGGAWYLEEVQFAVPVPQRGIVDAIARYREVASSRSSELLSPLPGSPAVPMTPENAPAKEGEPVADAKSQRWVAEWGGVTVYGGRLSSFVIRSCRFEGTASFSFRHVAGSGLDIVEQRGGRFEIFGSAMRQITITTAIGESSTGFDFTASWSALMQIWIGDNIRGSFAASYGPLVQVWNGSTDFSFTAEECDFFNVVNVDVGTKSKPIDKGGRPFTLDQADPDGMMAARARNMNYRRNPALVKMRQQRPQAAAARRISNVEVEG